MHDEELYYQHKLARLSAVQCSMPSWSVSHCVEWLGSTWPYAQWTMEHMGTPRSLPAQPVQGAPVTLFRVVPAPLRGQICVGSGCLRPS